VTKQAVITVLKTLPKEFDLDALFERLVFVEKVEEGFAQLDQGECKTHEEVKEIVKSWNCKL
jgi:predicted transcriptional regulator